MDWIVAFFCGAFVFAVCGAIVFDRPCSALLYSFDRPWPSVASIMEERFWEFTGIEIYMCFHMYFLMMVAALVKAPRWGWVYRP
jgi:hypothetical protein